MKPKIITDEAGRHIEQTRSPNGLFYYPAKNLDGRRLIWVGIVNLPGDFRKRKFDGFGECIEWLTGREFSRKGDDGNG